MWPNAAVAGALHVVSTPIGNLGDITLRGLAVLSQSSLVCCEDTRQSRVLLGRYGIRTPMRALHEHNEVAATGAIVAQLGRGDAIALISDAGTPLVSDPGERLVQAVIAAGHRVIPIPGASATLSALVASGITAQPWTMLGFLPRKGGERRAMLELAATLPHTVILFEAPGRLVATLGALSALAGEGRVATVARELTKHFEEFRRGTLRELTAYYEQTPARGEIVIVLAGATVEPTSEEALLRAADEMRSAGQSPREILQQLIDTYGASRNVAYRLAHDT